ncbi:MAG: hypothetical protein QG594_505 [Bacteroidota bacterium]|nr:hypothetical protein [Bacteroidota bacterium]
MINIRKATELDDIYQAFRGEPLKIEELEEFYHDAGKSRSKVNPRTRIGRLLKKGLGTSEHILFVGYKGCGKSTELNKLQKEISDEF